MKLNKMDLIRRYWPILLAIVSIIIGWANVQSELGQKADQSEMLLLAEKAAAERRILELRVDTLDDIYKKFDDVPNQLGRLTERMEALSTNIADFKEETRAQFKRFE